MRDHVLIDETHFKKVIAASNGKISASIPFLNDVSSDNIVKPQVNGKQRKCCQIPHSAISEPLLQKLIDSLVVS
jgi:helix-turn-helix protein